MHVRVCVGVCECMRLCIARPQKPVPGRTGIPRQTTNPARTEVRLSGHHFSHSGNRNQGNRNQGQAPEEADEQALTVRAEDAPSAQLNGSTGKVPLQNFHISLSG